MVRLSAFGCIFISYGLEFGEGSDKARFIPVHVERRTNAATKTVTDEGDRDFRPVEMFGSW